MIWLVLQLIDRQREGESPCHSGLYRIAIQGGEVSGERLAKDRINWQLLEKCPVRSDLHGTLGQPADYMYVHT